MAQNIDPTDIQEALGGLDYPATKEELIQHAEQHDADPQVMTFLERIEEGNYESPADVQSELSKVNDLDESGLQPPAV